MQLTCLRARASEWWVMESPQGANARLVTRHFGSRSLAMLASRATAQWLCHSELR